LSQNILIVGASGGVGRALGDIYKAKGYQLIGWSRANTNQNLDRYHHISFEKPESIEKASLSLPPALSRIVVCTGFLHDQSLEPEKTYKQLDVKHMQHAFLINTIGPMLVAKAVFQKLKALQQGVFACLSARVGSISDNRLGGWYSYRASKSALHQMMKTLSIEAARTHKSMAVISLHPGTVDTQLSRPFQKNVPKNQLFSPEQSAKHLHEVIETCTPDHTGKIFDWAGREIVP